MRLSDSQHNQGYKFEHQACAVEHDVERNQALKTESQAKCPATRADENGSPGSVCAVAGFRKEFRQHSFACHRERKPGIAHDKSVKHTERAHHSAQNNQEAQPLNAKKFAAD